MVNWQSALYYYDLDVANRMMIVQQFNDITDQEI